MSNQNIDALNDTLKTLIDSRKGYEKACEMCDDTSLKSTLESRADDRKQLISDLQSRVRELGGEPESEGGALGKAHRTLMDLTGSFSDNRETALKSIDDGEDYLQSRIEIQLETDDLEPQTRQLLERAKASAYAGEHLADRLQDH
ncbi:ferritin-like domain-containing protein [Hyphobacterium sp.]|uniref:ferritin-like domain-containing protein n=1 Tax=Hyphobacterium sp. TaxID=2004662 RepID=UPI003B52AA88